MMKEDLFYQPIVHCLDISLAKTPKISFLPFQSKLHKIQRSKQTGCNADSYRINISNCAIATDGRSNSLACLGLIPT